MTLPRRWFDRLGFVAVSGGVFAVELVRGLKLVTVGLHVLGVALVVTVPQALFSSLGFAAFVAVSGVLFVAQLATGSGTGPAPPPGDEPVTAVVPVHGDADALDASVGSLLDSTYPVEVVVVCEPGDRPSLERAAALAAEHDAVTRLVNERYPGTKAGAVNYAVEETGTSYLGVFDADERVDPRFLARAVAELRDADVVQGRTVPRPTGPVETLAYYESVLLNYAVQRPLYALTGFRMAASRAVVCRREALAAVGGYDPAMLAEDYHFAFECYRADLRVRELLAYPSTIEAAHSMRDWWGQRKRWMRGYAQVAHRLAGEAVPTTDRRDVLAAVICGGTLLGGLLLVSVLSHLAAFVLAGDAVLALLPVGTVVALALAVRYLDHRGGVVDGVGLGWLVAPVVLPLYGVVATKALLEYANHGVGEWYHVAKGG